MGGASESFSIVSYETTFNPAKCAVDRRQFVHLFGAGEKRQASAAVANLPQNLRPGQRRVQSHMHAAHQMHRQVHQNPFISIRADLHDPIARLDAQSPQHHRHPPHVAGQFSPTERAERLLAPLAPCGRGVGGEG